MMVEFNSVSFSYTENGTGAVHDISFAIPEGQFVLVCGASGCGKTTITRLINGLIPHFFSGHLSGSVRVAGRETSATPIADISDTVGSVFQNPRTQFFNADTDSEIVFGMENRGMPVNDILERLEAVTAELNLQRLRSKNIFELSGGEKQKIAFASAYAAFPKVLVLDEPSSNLDYHSILELARLLKKAKNGGLTVIVSEHRLWYVTDIIDRVLFMKNGRIEKDLSAREFNDLAEKPYSEFGLRTRTCIVPESSQECNMRCEMAGGTDGSTVLTAENLSVQIGKHTILNGVSFEVRAGEILAITGKNGSGKTTLARVLCGLQKSCGTVRLNARRLNNRERKNISYMVMQDVGHQLFTDSVQAECSLGIKEANAAQIEHALRAMGLNEYKDRHPLALSGGQRQRLAVAVSMICGKQLLVFDEPTSGLDLHSMHQVARLLKELARQNKLVIVITHDYELIETACTRVMNIDYINKTGQGAKMQKQKLLLYGTQMKSLVDTLSNKSAEKNAALVLRMESEYKHLLSEQSFANAMLARHLKKSILPAVAAYKMLLAAGKTKEQAFEAVRASVLSDSEKQKRAFQKIGTLPFGFSLMRLMTPLSLKTTFGPSGWDFTWKQNDRRALKWDCSRCFYADIFTQHKVSELTAIFCESDDVVYGSIPTIRWARTRTIGNGDDICDFVFYNERTKNAHIENKRGKDKGKKAGNHV